MAHVDSNFDYSFAYLEIPEDLDFSNHNVKWVSLSKYIKDKGIERPDKLFEQIRVEDIQQ